MFYECTPTNTIKHYFYKKTWMEKSDKKYTNGEITVFWQPRKCIHATTCYRELIDVFNPRKRPWINMDGASTKEIIRVVKLCPTQALTYRDNKEIDAEKQAEETAEIQDANAEARVMEDGPLVIKGSFVLLDTEGKELQHLKMSSLCRCGASNNLPYCDGTHRKIGYIGK
jgi:uncharacterized Fe-S cluster protein YjdI